MTSGAHATRDPVGERPERVMRTVTVREELARFAEAMEVTLQRNDHKKHWRTVTIEYCLQRLREEVGELEGAVVGAAQLGHVQAEATDVANFAMFIWDLIEESKR